MQQKRPKTIKKINIYTKTARGILKNRTERVRIVYIKRLRTKDDMRANEIDFIVKIFFKMIR
jgi:hypothetical protein